MSTDTKHTLGTFKYQRLGASWAVIDGRFNHILALRPDEDSAKQLVCKLQTGEIKWRGEPPMTNRGPKAFSGHPLCYCASLVDTTCDFCSGVRKAPEPQGNAQNEEACDCRLLPPHAGRQRYEIAYCPLHAAARDLLATPTERQLNLWAREYFDVLGYREWERPGTHAAFKELVKLLKIVARNSE